MTETQSPRLAIVTPLRKPEAAGEAPCEPLPLSGVDPHEPGRVRSLMIPRSAWDALDDYVDAIARVTPRGTSRKEIVARIVAALEHSGIDERVIADIVAERKARKSA